MHHRFRLLIPLALAAGCTPAEMGGREPRQAKVPAGYHRAVPTPIDPAVQAAARRQLVLALQSPEELVRAHALEVIADVGPNNPAPLVVPLLDDPSPLVRKAAAISAGRLKIAAARGAVLRLAAPKVSANDSADPNQPTYVQQARLAAIFALHQLGDARYTHEFELSARDPRPQIRGDTALLLEWIGNTSSTPLLTQMMTHDVSENVRLQAAEALWKMGDQRGEDFLITALQSGYISDVMVALMALAGPRDRRVFKNVFGFLTYDEHPEVSIVAARAAGQLGSDDGVGVAEAAAKDGDPLRRSLGALALGDIGRADSQPILAKLLDDDTPDVRLTAAAALLEIGKR